MNSKNKFECFVRSGKHSETLMINQLSHLRAENNQDIFRFGFGQSPFPVPKQIVEKLSAAAHRKEYMSVQGHPPLRRAIANFHRVFENKVWDPEQIIVAAGSKILIFCIMAAFERAEVLLPGPSWVSYEPQAKLAGHDYTWIITDYQDAWKLTPEQLEQHCAKRKNQHIPLILVFNYPSNPTGQSYSAEELQALAEIMKKYDVIVIADEIYSLLSYQDQYSTLEDFYPEGCIVSSGLSKWCGAGGWRLGFHHIPKQLGEQFFQAVISVASETYSCAPSPVQIAATEAYQNIDLAKSFLQQQKQILSEVSRYCSDKLRDNNIAVHDAQGGFYLLPDFAFYKNKLASKGILTSETLTTILLEETGVALLPGSAFGMPPSILVTRLAFVDFDGAQIWNDCKKNVQFDKVKLGIERLCQWLEVL